MRSRFPTVEARRKADEAIDPLDVDRSMIEFIVVWIAAYKAAGGKLPVWTKP
jgi:hypothetical protein